MRSILLISFGGLILVSIIVWLVGVLAGAVFPLFGGVSAERLGAIGFIVGMAGESCAYIFGGLRNHITRKDAQPFKGLLGPKKYGNKNNAA